MGISSLIASIGSAIHAKRGERASAFLKGASKGAFGGGLVYLGKDVGAQINRENWVGWPSKVLVSAGSSIVENAYWNKPWH